jgi:hypothetical protein
MLPGMDGGPPLESYKRRIQELQDRVEKVNARTQRRYAILTLLALLCVAVLLLAFRHGWNYAWFAALVLPAGAFVIEKISRDRSEVMRLVVLHDYYERGIARLGLDWNALDGGVEFQDTSHLYAPDLDLFGRASLFQILCSARTQAGREALARWMKEPASGDEVLARQEAIAELLPRRDLRERIAAAGRLHFSNCDTRTFRTWVTERASQEAFPRWLPYAAALLVLALFAPPVLYGMGHLALRQMWQGVVAVLALEGAFALIFRERMRFVLQSVGPLSVEIPLLCELLSLIEQEKFSSRKLVGLANRLKSDGHAASREMRHLRRLIKLLNERDNEFFTYPSFALLWGTQFSAAIDRWHRRRGIRIPEWLGILGEFEALISLSTYATEHPNDTLPEFVESGPLLEANALGHPLIDEKVCIRNDVRLGEDLRFLIVSGSNMSGKSTFLRAIGTNVVLARMGAPVRCARLRLSPLAVGAAIRISDSLAEGRSHFFAEMDRLRRLIELAGKEPLLFLADEIMIGTNSHDRRIAAEWVVRALVRRNAIGLVTTHDLALTEIARNGLPGSNAYFEDSGGSGELRFDYHLRPGVLSHSNALNIAHILGIDAAADEGAAPGATSNPAIVES